MLSILINAYACSPDMGSEPGMAWNWCVNLARHCELYIITEGEFRDKIEDVVLKLPQGKNMHFYYNPVSAKVRRMCWNQGDWRFYWHYRKWQQKTLQIARDIIAQHHIDILHQLNMIGFREPGYLWRIKDIPFVWGPIGGMELVPVAYLKGAGWKTILKNRIKNVINTWQMHHQPRVLRAVNGASMLIAATGGAYKVLHDYLHKDNVVLINETGCYEQTLPLSTTVTNANKRTFDILWVGKFDFRKQLCLALRIMKELEAYENIHLNIVGAGNKIENKYYMTMSEDFGLDKTVSFLGQMPHLEVERMMSEADLFLFTSISDETSTVILEAIGQNLPILCFDACGFGPLVTPDIGRKVIFSNIEQSIRDFTKIILQLYSNPYILASMSENCKKRQKTLTWGYKAKKMVELYNKLKEDMST